MFPSQSSYIRNHHPYHQLAYTPPYYAFPPGFDPSVSLAHPYIYDPTHIKHRRRTTPEQLKILENTFKTEPKPNPALRKELSIKLGMSPRVLQVWFQNRRMKVKRLAKKQNVAEQRAASPDSEHREQQDPSSSPAASPSKSPSSPPSEASASPADSPPADDNPPPAAARPELPSRHGSLPVLPFDFEDHHTTFDAVSDPASRSRPITSLHHPFAPLVTPRNVVHQHPSPDHHLPQSFSGIVPPSLPPSFRHRPPGNPSTIYHHHHSPSTPAPHPVISPLPHTSRAASFHSIPADHRIHGFPLHQPYAFPPRPIPAPGPGPLPAPDYSFGTTAPCSDDTQEEFDVRPYIPSISTPSYSVQAAAAAAAGFPFSVPRLVRQDDDTDASTSYTSYSSRLGSIASLAESDASGTSLCGRAPSVSSAPGSVGPWDGTDSWAEEGRRGSWTGQVAEMLSGLDVRGDTDKAEEIRYNALWEPYNSSSSQESLGAYAHGQQPPNTAKDDHRSAPPPLPLSYCNAEDGTPPAAAPAPQQYTASRYPISQSSELAFALCGQDTGKQQQQHGSQNYSSSAHGQQGQEEMRHALAGFSEHSPVEGGPYSIGNFSSQAQDSLADAVYNMY